MNSKEESALTYDESIRLEVEIKANIVSTNLEVMWCCPEPEQGPAVVTVNVRLRDSTKWQQMSYSLKESAIRWVTASVCSVVDRVGWCRSAQHILIAYLILAESPRSAVTRARTRPPRWPPPPTARAVWCSTSTRWTGTASSGSTCVTRSGRPSPRSSRRR
jgi:hypothetical protein